MRSKLLKILSVLVAVIIAFSFICIPVSAENYVHTYYSPIAKPDLNDNSGYAELLIQYQNGEYGTLVVFWECFTEGDFTSYVEIYCDNGSFYIEPTISTHSGVFTFRTFESNGWSDTQSNLYADGMIKNLTFGGGNIMHCINAHYYGNVAKVNQHPGWNVNFEVLYGGEIGNYNSIREIVDELYQIHASNNVIVQFLDYMLAETIESNEKQDLMLEFFQHILNENISTNSKLDMIAEILGSNTDRITQNQDENTDKVLNGDSDLDSSGETDKVDGTIGGIDDATSNAMGGKTDEQIQAEVESSLDPDKIGLDFNKAQRLSVFFDDTLNTFGSSYKALLLLSLSLGLAAFLIGRRYG